MKRRDVLKLPLYTFLGGTHAMKNGTSESFVEHASATGFTTTLARVVTAINEAGMTIFGQIDHAAAAKAVGLTMPPTVVILYGNPRGGTPVMLAAPAAALDLPLRVLLREDHDRGTLLSFHPIGAVLQQVGVPAEMAARLAPGQDVLLKALDG